jgi:hypothetical protein
MTTDPDASATSTGSPALDGPHNRWQMLRWFVSSATLNVPQAAGPVAFSLVAISLIGRASGGAAMMLAMTIAQVVGAVPITRLGRHLPATTFLRLLITFRTLALVGVTLCAHYQAPFACLVALAALAGSVNGAAFGYLRSLLNHITPASRLPRAIGVAATLNELIFVLGPVAASGLGSISPVFAVLALTIFGAIPALLVPRAGRCHVEDAVSTTSSILSPSILLWLTCAAAGGATVAAIEIGAVALALRFGYEPTMAILFTVPLCIASVAGGIWVSAQNRMVTQKAVLALLFLMTVGSALVAFGPSLATTVIGAIFVGFVLAPLATYYSLVLDQLAPPQKRPEVFALLRTANATGVIFASAVLTAVSLSSALTVVTCSMIAMTVTVAFATVVCRSGQSYTRSETF